MDSFAARVLNSSGGCERSPCFFGSSRPCWSLRQQAAASSVRSTFFVNRQTSRRLVSPWFGNAVRLSDGLCGPEIRPTIVRPEKFDARPQATTGFQLEACRCGSGAPRAGCAAALTNSW